MHIKCAHILYDHIIKSRDAAADNKKNNLCCFVLHESISICVCTRVRVCKQKTRRQSQARKMPGVARCTEYLPVSSSVAGG